jgi:hypothetical protein
MTLHCLYLTITRAAELNSVALVIVRQQSRSIYEAALSFFLPLFEVNVITKSTEIVGQVILT